MSTSASLAVAARTLASSSFSRSDSAVFSAFLVRLAAILDAEDQDWRETTVLYFDNATYHWSEDAVRAMTAFQIPAVLAGPYGYDGSPCEKLFAHMKVGDLNPADIATGKR